jgi:hypothetical protein
MRSIAIAAARRVGLPCIIPALLISLLALSDSPSLAQKTGGGAASPKETAERKKAVERWKQSIRSIHDNGLHAQGRDSAERRAAAEAKLDAITDPDAAPAAWSILAGKSDHHPLLVRLLGRIDTAESTRMLAAVALYSDDSDARLRATESLKGRDTKDFAEDMIELIRPALKYRRGRVNLPDVGRAEVLLVEDERVDYRFLYPPAERPQGPVNPRGIYTLDNPYMNKQARAQAKAYNQAQMQMARESIAAQLNSDIAQVQILNQRIGELKERAVNALREVSGRNLPPNREAWRRWLAQREGTTYVPPTQEPKRSLAMIVPHLYTPDFIRIPAPT